MHTLNPRQLEAVLHIDTPLLVLAGAGSGKTRVITEKIAYLVRKHQIKPNNIFAVTFTNKAAREMKARVAKLVTEDTPLKGLQVSTFHTLGLNILRREYKALEYKPNFSIMDAADSGQMLKDLMRKNDLDPEELAGVQWEISNFKNQHISPEKAFDLAENPMQQARALLYQAYQKQLKAYNAVDFDDLIGLPVKIFNEHPEILEKWQNRVRYLLVDEYQDTNAAQYKLVQQLVGLSGKLTVVGDDDQSIYAWRGAQPENMALLQQDFPGLEVVKLEQNYRSSQKILQCANQLISNNPHVFDKQLWSDKGVGDQIRIIACGDEIQEAERIVSELIIHKFKYKAQNKDCAILYRSNHQARLIERVLREQNIPYILSGGTSFFDRSEIKDVMSYLKLIINLDDDAAFLRIINTPKREIGVSTLEKLANYATSRGVSLFDATQEMGLYQVLPEKTVAKLQQFGAVLLGWAKDAEYLQGKEVAPFVREILQTIEYDDYLMDTSASAKTAEKRIEQVRDFLLWIERIIDKAIEEDDEELKLGKIVSHMTLMDILERNAEEDEEHNMVSLMTLHASKGLEFPHVFLIGVEEEILPHRQNLESPGLEEERRLAYVGITRAQRSLTISYAKKRRQYGEEVSCQPSRFLEELPADILEWEGKPGVVLTHEQKVAVAEDAIANIRQMLAANNQK